MSFNKFKSSDSDSGPPGGMLTLIVVVILLMFGFGYWVWTESPVWSWGFIKSRAEESLNSSSIVESEKAEIMDVFEALSTKIDDHSIGWLEIPKLLESVSKSDFAPIALSIYLQAAAVQPLNLSEEEAKRAHKAILRLNWAVMNDGVPAEELEPLMERLGKPQNDQVTVTLGKNLFLSKEELLTFISEAEELLNKHNVPEHPFDFDPSDAFRKAVQDFIGTEAELENKKPVAL